jgi:hypothetical protein
VSVGTAPGHCRTMTSCVAANRVTTGLSGETRALKSASACDGVLVAISVEVSANLFTVPPECACCGACAEMMVNAEATRVTGKRVIHTYTRSLAFPRYRACDDHVRRWNSAPIFAVMIGLAVGGLACVAAGHAVSQAAGAIFIATCVVTSIAHFWLRHRVTQSCSAACAAPCAPVNYVRWYGTVKTFAFQSNGYAVGFALGNGKHLVNVSTRLRTLIEAAHAEHIARAGRAVVVAMPAPRATPPALQAARPEPVLEWIARIESYKGAEARRSAVDRALLEIHTPDGRDQLLAAASRIEVTAVLDKVDSLKSAAAKRRHLENAIAELRGRGIPEDARRSLDDRLRSLA